MNLRLTYELLDGDARVSSLSEQYDIGEESWRMIPEIRQAVFEIVTPPEGS